MELEINLNGRKAKVSLLSKEDNLMKVSLDGVEFDLDIVMVERGVYSILYKDQSYNIELNEGQNSKNYTVNTPKKSFDIEILDAESKYLKSRQKNSDLEGENTIMCPMPGKIIKIPVKKGETVKPGQTAIIVSAMKMESEYKVKKNGIIKEVLVKEGDTVEGNQALIVIE